MSEVGVGGVVFQIRNGGGGSPTKIQKLISGGGGGGGGGLLFGTGRYRTFGKTQVFKVYTNVFLNICLGAHFSVKLS